MKPQSDPSPCPPPKAPHVNMGESRPPSRRYRKAVWATLPPHFRPCSNLPLPTSQLKPFQTPTAHPPFRPATPPSRLSLKHTTRLKPALRAPIPHPENTANLRQNTASPPSGTPDFIPHHATAIIPPCCPPLNTLRASSPLPGHQYHSPKTPPTCGRTPRHHPPALPDSIPHHVTIIIVTSMRNKSSPSQTRMNF